MYLIIFCIANAIHWLTVAFSYPYLPIIFKIIGYMIFFLQIISHGVLALGNPGIPNKNNYLSGELMTYLKDNKLESKTMFEFFRICRECKILITFDKTITHCKQCNICVTGILCVLTFKFNRSGSSLLYDW